MTFVDGVVGRLEGSRGCGVLTRPAIREQRRRSAANPGKPGSVCTDSRSGGYGPAFQGAWPPLGRPAPRACGCAVTWASSEAREAPCTPSAWVCLAVRTPASCRVGHFLLGQSFFAGPAASCLLRSVHLTQQDAPDPAKCEKASSTALRLTAGARPFMPQQFPQGVWPASGEAGYASRIIHRHHNAFARPDQGYLHQSANNLQPSIVALNSRGSRWA